MPALSSTFLRLVAVSTLIGAGFVAPAMGQVNHDAHGAHGAAQSAPASASTAAFQAANAKMHKGMDIPYSGDADVDFVRGMIAHHQGAIDMAKVEISYGKDPRMLKLAQEIIAAQEKEIADMKAWLSARGL